MELENGREGVNDLEHVGLRLVERVKLKTGSQEPAAHYMRTKKEKLGHVL